MHTPVPPIFRCLTSRLRRKEGQERLIPAHAIYHILPFANHPLSSTGASAPLQPQALTSATPPPKREPTAAGGDGLRSGCLRREVGREAGEARGTARDLGVHTDPGSKPVGECGRRM